MTVKYTPNPAQARMIAAFGQHTGATAIADIMYLTIKTKYCNAKHILWKD